MSDENPVPDILLESKCCNCFAAILTTEPYTKFINPEKFINNDYCSKCARLVITNNHKSVG